MPAREHIFVDNGGSSIELLNFPMTQARDGIENKVLQNSNNAAGGWMSGRNMP